MAWIIVALVVGARLVGADQEDVEGGKCERIQLPLCQDLGYNFTAMPNLLGHRTQKEAEEAVKDSHRTGAGADEIYVPNLYYFEELSFLGAYTEPCRKTRDTLESEMASFAGIVESGCSAQARFVVCSAFAPLCSEQVAGPVAACRALCDAVAEQCRAHVAALPAPLALDCSTFPLRPERRLCMRPPGAEPPPDEAPAWLAAGRAACPPGQARSPAGACVPACGPRPAPARVSEVLLTALAWLALLATLLALLTFCAEPARYRYPERPAVWVAVCHAAVALAYVTRGWYGTSSDCSGSSAADGLGAPACVAFFAVTYYFTLAADAWFANACVSWYLTAASEWSTEALERAAAYLHAAAWGWAGAWTAAALALRRGAAEEAAGACSGAAGAAAALLGVPRAAPLLGAALLGAGAAPGVARLRRALAARGAARVGRLAARAAAVGLLYLVLSAAAAATRVWAAARGPGGALAPALGLCAGVAAALWACSRKSATVWRRALCPPRKSRPPAPPLLAPPLLTPNTGYCKRPLHMTHV